MTIPPSTPADPPEVTLSQEAMAIRSILLTHCATAGVRVAAITIDRHERVDLILARAPNQRGPSAVDIWVDLAFALNREKIQANLHSLATGLGPGPIQPLAAINLVIVSNPSQILVMHPELPAFLDRYLATPEGMAAASVALRQELAMRAELVTMATSELRHWTGRLDGIEALLNQCARLQGAITRLDGGRLALAGGGLLDLQVDADKGQLGDVLLGLGRLAVSEPTEAKLLEAQLLAAKLPTIAAVPDSPADREQLSSVLFDLHSHLKLAPVDAGLRGLSLNGPISPAGNPLGWRAPPPFIELVRLQGFDGGETPEDFSL